MLVALNTSFLDEVDGSAPSIFLNSIQAKHLNWGLKEDPETHESFLLMINSCSEGIGMILKEPEFSCDFLILVHEVPISEVEILEQYRSAQ